MQSRRHFVRRPSLLMAVLSAVLLVGCGGSDDEPPVNSVRADSPEHIHGLGVNPADGALFIATHTGLWRAASDSRRASRIGETQQDVMGFTVVGANHFLGSGHPDARQDLPPLLGLIESRSGGRNWKSISLLGEADFHILRYREGRVYGFDATNGRLLASADRGRSWRELSAPAPLLDLAIDPQDVDTVVASTAQGLHRSRDGGSTWRPLRKNVGLLAWPTPAALYLIDARGQVHRSRDGGAGFRRIGAIRGQPAAFNHHRDELLAALHDSTVVRSTDGGFSWTVRAQP
jgi:hypothetical protein